MKRRSLALLFIMLLAVLAFAGCTENEIEKEPVAITHLLRIGVLSDIHSNTSPMYDPLERVEKALLFLRQKVSMAF